ncbi:MAG: response regulator [Fibrobacteres bacterium]|nr:response regulator [Fibrobacterota bacterium]
MAEVLRTFVVADDELNIRNIVGDMLECFGYTPVLLADGEEALKYFHAECHSDRKPIAIMLDLSMPKGMGGCEAVAEIRKLCKETPVFAITGQINDPVIENPSSFGFNAAICKPFKMKEFADFLNKYL